MSRRRNADHYSTNERDQTRRMTMLTRTIVKTTTKARLIILMCGVLVLGMTMEALAASARVRCRVKDGRVRVQVDGMGLAPGLYSATVRNLNTNAKATTEPGKRRSPVGGKVDLDFDSTAQADDADSFIPATFASPGHNVRAVINPGAVANATATCTR
jgi:hypothetical protein